MAGILSPQIKSSMDESVLCWLATSNNNNEPNVSPKEIFQWINDNEIIIANVASPISAKNIQENPKVCLSFVHVFKQKGFQLKGDAKYISNKHQSFTQLSEFLDDSITEKYPLLGIFLINVRSAKPILAPSYLLFPNTTEEQQINSAKKSYGC